MGKYESENSSDKSGDDWFQGREFGVISPKQAQGLSGLEVIRGMIEGTFPVPTMARALNFILEDANEGRAVFRGRPTDQFFNPLGSIHGGWACTLLDSALGCAVHTLVPAGMAYTTVELKVNMTRPIMPDSGDYLAEGRVIHAGRSIATAEGTLKGADNGKLYAHATTTCMFFPANAAVKARGE